MQNELNIKENCKTNAKIEHIDENTSMTIFFLYKTYWGKSVKEKKRKKNPKKFILKMINLCASDIVDLKNTYDFFVLGNIFCPPWCINKNADEIHFY